MLFPVTQHIDRLSAKRTADVSARQDPSAHASHGFLEVDLPPRPVHVRRLLTAPNKKDDDSCVRRINYKVNKMVGEGMPAPEVMKYRSVNRCV